MYETLSDAEFLWVKPAGHHKKWLADQIATHTLIPQPNVPVYYKKIHGEIKIISKLIVMTK